MKKGFIKMVLFYQRYISVLMLPRCRFYPCCSEYTIDAINEYGVLRGLFMSIKRLCRCHPLSKGGVDPVTQNQKEF